MKNRNIARTAASHLLENHNIWMRLQRRNMDLQLFRILFNRSEAAQQAEAHQRLTEAQNSPQVWSFVWELLHLQRSSELQFFVATAIIHTDPHHWSKAFE